MEAGAEGSMGRKTVWGGRQSGAEGRLGQPTDRRGFQPALAPNLNPSFPIYKTHEPRHRALFSPKRLGKARTQAS